MTLAFRILAVIAISAFVTPTVPLVLGWIRFGFDIPLNLVDSYLFAFLVAAIASLLLVPLLLLVQTLAPTGLRGGLVLGASLLGGVLLGTLMLIQSKHFTLDLPDLVGRSWKVYAYFITFGVTYGAMWILLVKDRLEAAMTYKASCPSCGKKMSRWLLCCEPTIYYRCRGCSARMRVSRGGWIAAFGAFALVLGCYFLYRDGVLARSVAIALIAVQVVTITWLSPYLLPLQLAEAKKRSDENAA